MDIPDLVPDFSFQRLADRPSDKDFAFEIKRQAMEPHIIARWGWDEAFQRAVHDRHYSVKPFFAIVRAHEKVGTISWQSLQDHFQLGEFYLLPKYQRQGWGSVILEHVLHIADSAKHPVRLEHLQWNPVGALYRRHGFLETGRSDIHIFMERPVQHL